MPDPVSCIIGCLPGGCFGAYSFWKSRPPGVANGKAASVASPNAARWASPPSHLRRASPGPAGAAHGGQQISADISLTQQKADFSLVPGVSQKLDDTLFVELLRQLIGVSKQLQNNPRLGIVPEEGLASKIVTDELEKYSTKAGGPLVIEELVYTPGRTNLKITYPGTTKDTVAFVGSHFDVVPADPESWEMDPFSLTIDGEKLFGRGTTDCLCHVALITCLLVELAKAKPKLKRSVVVLFIAGEEGGEKGVGVDCAVNAGKLDEVKRGPVYWVDSADSQPCCGTSGMLGWSVKCTGRLFHSGFPHKGINSIELAAEVVKEIQQRFFDDFPSLPQEEAYRFSTGSHMKPTQIDCAKGSANQICPECTVHGDIRLSPFYEVEDVVDAMEQYVKDINDYVEDLPVRGPYSKYVLKEDVAVNDNELRRGKVELKWNGTMETFKLYAGIAVNLDSVGHRALIQAHREAYDLVQPFSVSGSLPLVNMMQKAGFDIQMCGFGVMSVYHGVNEYCTLSGMQKGYEVLLRVVALLESKA